MRTGLILMKMLAVAGLFASCAPPEGVAKGTASDPTVQVGQDSSSPTLTMAPPPTVTTTPTDAVAPLPTATPPATPAPRSPTPTRQGPAATPTPTASLLPTLVSSPTTRVEATPTASPTAPPATADPPQDREDLVALGMKVYQERYCGLCHQLGAAGTGGVFGPTHDGMGVTASARLQDPAYGGEATTPAEYVRESLVRPQAYVVPGYEITSHPMPGYDFLSEQEILALVEMLLAQR